MTKELEAKLGLKVSVIGAGTQLQLLSEANRDSDKNHEDKETFPDPDLSPIDSQLRQMELDWSGLMENVPVVQQTLHKVRNSET